MEISKKQIEITTLYASEGMYLTQSNRGDKMPILSNEVILGKTDSIDNWVEIPISEGDAIMAQWQAEQELIMQQEMNNL